MNASDSLLNKLRVPPQIYSLTDDRYYSYWSRFAPIPKWVHGVIAVYSTFLLVFGSLGNLFAIGLYIKFKTLRSPSNLLLCNLALSDLMILVTNCPIHILSHINEKWVFGIVGCEIYGFMGTMFGLLSINTIAAITLDRAYSIVNALKGKKLSYKWAFCIIGSVWTYCLTWSTLPLLGWSKFIFEGGVTSCTVDYLSTDPISKSYVYALFVFCFCIPFTIICVTYGTIYYIISRNRNTIELQASELTTNRFHKFMNDYKWSIKMAKMVFYILMGYLIAWLPYTVVVLLCLGGKSALVTPIISASAAIYAKTSAVYNPYIYIITNDKVKKLIFDSFANYMGYDVSTQYDTDSVGTSVGDRGTSVKVNKSRSGSRKTLRTRADASTMRLARMNTIKVEI